MVFRAFRETVHTLWPIRTDTLPGRSVEAPSLYRSAVRASVDRTSMSPISRHSFRLPVRFGHILCAVGLLTFGQVAASQEVEEPPQTEPTAPPESAPAPSPEVEPPPPPQEEPTPRPQDPSPETERPLEEPPALDAATILTAAVEAIGTKEAVAAVQSFSLKANMSAAMGDLKFEVKSNRAGAFIVKQSKSGVAAATVYFDGREAWIASPDGGYDLVDQSLLMQGRQQFELMFPIWFALTPTEATTSVTATGRAAFNELDCHIVRLETDHDGSIERFGHYDASTFLMQGMSMVIAGPDARPVEFIFGDWKPIGEINLFHSILIKRFGESMTVTYTDLAFDTVDFTVFARPAEVAELLRQRDGESSSSEPAAPNEPGTPPLDDDDVPAPSPDAPKPPEEPETFGPGERDRS